MQFLNLQKEKRPYWLHWNKKISASENIALFWSNAVQEQCSTAEHFQHLSSIKIQFTPNVVWANWTLNLETSLLKQHRRHVDLLQNACVSEQYVWLCQRHVIVAQMALSKNKAELAKISPRYKYSVTYIWPALDNSAYVTNSPSSLWVCREKRRHCAKILASTKVDHRFLSLAFHSVCIKNISNWI